MTPHEINDKNNFIMAWRFEDTAFCEPVINFYNSQEPVRGTVKNTSGNTVDIKIKDSYDVYIADEENVKPYFVHLQKCVNMYIEKYTFCNEGAPWIITEKVNIQKYLPNGGFHSWHHERDGRPSTLTRHLVFMTYLNDVTDAGDTEFLYQNTKITPEKGLTVIWPADWTFTHRGIPSPTQEKMIVTGWLNYCLSETQGT